MRKYSAVTRWLSLCLIIALFFSGLCFDGEKLQLYSDAPVNTSNAVLYEVQEHVTSPDYCTSEQLGNSSLKRVVEIINRSVDSHRTRLGSRFKVSLNVFTILPELAQFETWHDATGFFDAIFQCGKMIITYIHHQDGSKG